MNQTLPARLSDTDLRNPHPTKPQSSLTQSDAFVASRSEGGSLAASSSLTGTKLKGSNSGKQGLRSSGKNVGNSNSIPPPLSPPSSVLRHRRAKSNDLKKSVVVSYEEREKKNSSLWRQVAFWKKEEQENFRFYSAERDAKPEGDNIDNIHRVWFYKYDLLEEHHGYLQWLFPTFGSTSTNTKAFTLRAEEAQLIRQDINCCLRVILSYRMMMNFYGAEMIDINTGELRRHPQIWQSRFSNLNTSVHNYQRISRIIKSLNILGFKQYGKSLVDFFKNEIMESRVLPNCRRSLDQFWIPLLNSGEKEEEAIFFSQLDSAPVKQFQQDLEKGKCWKTTREAAYSRVAKNDDAEAITEFKQGLEKANQALMANTDVSSMTQHLSQNGGELGRSRDVTFSGMGFFKPHYNTEEEKQQAFEEFNTKVEAGKEDAADKRAKALSALQTMMIEKRKREVLNGGGTGPNILSQTQ